MAVVGLSPWHEMTELRPIPKDERGKMLRMKTKEKNNKKMKSVRN